VGGKRGRWWREGKLACDKNSKNKLKNKKLRYMCEFNSEITRKAERLIKNMSMKKMMNSLDNDD
jgi:hypothetical protein